MAGRRYTDAQRREAIAAVRALAKKLGKDLFGWGIRKHLALEAAERRVAKIRREAEKEISHLRRSAGL